MATCQLQKLDSVSNLSQSIGNSVRFRRSHITGERVQFIHAATAEALALPLTCEPLHCTKGQCEPSHRAKWQFEDWLHFPVDWIHPSADWLHWPAHCLHEPADKAGPVSNEASRLADKVSPLANEIHDCGSKATVENP